MTAGSCDTDDVHVDENERPYFVCGDVEQLPIGYMIFETIVEESHVVELKTFDCTPIAVSQLKMKSQSSMVETFERWHVINIPRPTSVTECCFDVWRQTPVE